MTDIVERLRDRQNPNRAARSIRDEVATEIERLRAEVAALQETLQFVERWANHHGSKPTCSAEAALSCIQHYPPIVAITRSYSDGQVPDTPDPWAEVAALRKDAARLDWIERHLFERKWDGTIGRKCDWYLVGNYRHVVQRMSGDTLRDAIDAALAKEKP